MLLADLQTLIVNVLSEIKANDIVCLDVRKLTDITDLMVICSGTSNRHVKSIGEHLVETVKKHGVKPLGIEGEEIGEWVLVDLADAVVHIMLPQTRDFYQLEKLWDFSE